MENLKEIARDLMYYGYVFRYFINNYCSKENGELIYTEQDLKDLWHNEFEIMANNF